MSLQNIRVEIDQLDQQMVELFKERMTLAKQVAFEKIKTGQKIENQAREQEVLAKVMIQSGNEIEEYTKLLYTCLFDLSRSYQAKIVHLTNIILVGMPGVGKTTIGKEVAKSMNREFIDLDEYIISASGKSSEQWINENGEDAFRNIETKSLNDVMKKKNVVIATGGGAVIKESNRNLLKENSKIYWLKRPLELLEISGRPLSVDLNRLYEIREQYYEQVADKKIDNTLLPEQVAQDIVDDFLSPLQ